MLCLTQSHEKLQLNLSIPPHRVRVFLLDIQ